MTVCHKGKKSVRISLRAWLAHKRHGDAVGTCSAWKKAHGKHWKKKHGKAWQMQDGKASKKLQAKRWKKTDRQRRGGDGSSDTTSSEQGATFEVVSSGSGRGGKGAEFGGDGHKGDGNGKGAGKH